MLIAQMAADYKQKGMTLYEGLENLYKKYGNHLENLYTVTLKGLDGAEKIKKIMADIRKNPPKEVGGVKVKKMQDISIGKEFDIENGTEKDIDLPSSNVLKFFLEDNSYFAARPSGTEPKIKFYFGVCEETMEKSKSKMEQFKKDVIALVEG